MKKYNETYYPKVRSRGVMDKWNVTLYIFEGRGRYFFAAYFAPSLQ